MSTSSAAAGKPRSRDKRRKAIDRDLIEIETLAARVIEEAPEPGSNPLATDAAEISVEKHAFGHARKFEELPISQRTLQGLGKGKWLKMTDIQRAAIPHALAGRDVLGAAKTGSGKTLAFLVPMLELLYRERWSNVDGLGALVISPTRELALQIFDVLRVVGHSHELSAGLVIGGKDKREEASRICGMTVLVCTPGRLLQHLDETPFFEVGSVRMLVLDEADRMLDAGFQATLSAIVGGLPKARQTLLFSATQTKDVRVLARLSLRTPQYIGVHERSQSSTPSRLEHHYMVTGAESKIDVLFGFIRTHLQAKVLVFLSSCKQVQFYHGAFSALRPGIPLLCLHGRQKQMKRMATYTEFCNKAHAVLFATDVAARGLDFPKVQWVMQADCPEDVATYIHRTGRTARYTSSGRALMLLLPSERPMVEQLQAARVPLKKLQVNASKVHSLKPKLQAILSERQELKYTAQRAFVSYIRSVHLHSDKTVFDASALPLTELAESMGLLAPPRVRFLASAKPGAKNWKPSGKDAGPEGSDAETDDESSGGEGAAQGDVLGSGSDEEGDGGRGEEEEDDEDDSDSEGDGSGGRSRTQLAEIAHDEADESSDYEDDQNGLVLNGKEKKTKPRNKIKRMLARNTAQRRGEVLATSSKTAKSASTPSLGQEIKSSGPLLHVKRTIMPLADEVDEATGMGTVQPTKTKIKIRKGGTVTGGKRTVFDDNGDALEDKFGSGFEGIAAEKASRSDALGDTESRVAAVTARLKAKAAEDRRREQERVREKHKERKRKRKAAQAEDAGEEGDGEFVVTLGGAADPEDDDREDEDLGQGSAGSDDGKQVAHGGAKKRTRYHHEPARPGSIASEIQRDERAAEARLAMLLGGR